jgi:hypothetical protein
MLYVVSPAVKLTSIAESNHQGSRRDGLCSRTPTSTAAAPERPIAAHVYMLNCGNA